MKKIKGFTLVELLVVIAIIAILSVLITFSVAQVRARTRDSVRLADVDTFRKGLDLYLNSEGSYPVQTTQVCINGTDPVSVLMDAAGVLSKSIKDPFFVGSPQCYLYTSDLAGTSYAISFFLETSSLGDKGINFIP